MNPMREYVIRFIACNNEVTFSHVNARTKEEAFRVVAAMYRNSHSFKVHARKAAYVAYYATQKA